MFFSEEKNQKTFSNVRAGDIRVGIGGWTFPPWRANFYPEGLPHDHELAYASAHLTSIEINGTFYRQQTPETFASWRDGTPANFVFAVKAHRATTQSADPANALAAITRFLNSGLEELHEKLGPILWQFAPTKKYDPATLETFLTALPPTLNGRPLQHAVEARHPTFDDPAWITQARTHNIAIAIIDSDKQALRGDVTAAFIYARLQRNQAQAPEGYDSAALDQWATRLKNWSAGAPVSDLPLTIPAPPPQPRPCFCYCISGDKERAPHAAMALMKRL